MNDQELHFVKEHQQRLIEATRIEQQIRHLRSDSPAWSDYFLLRMGDSLIALGQRMKSGHSFTQPTQSTDLSQECA